MNLFLDANAHLPINENALKALVDFNGRLGGHGHPMSPSAPGRAAANAIEEARTRIAHLLGAKSSNQIVFASTCTQACRWAVEILNKRKNLWAAKITTHMSPTEHPAIQQAAEYIQPLKLIPTDSNGVISQTEFPERFVICIHLQNEIGVIQPIESIKCEYLLCDMCQTPGKLSIDLSSLDVDLALFGSHKFGGPCSVGFLYIKDINDWTEFGTGSRYFMDRTGTPDAASIVATAVALEEATNTLLERTQKMIEFRDVIEPGLKEMGFEIVAEEAKRCPNTTFVYMPGGLGMTAMFNLAEQGIHVGLGSACGSAYAGTSPLMAHLGRYGGPHDYMRVSQFGEYASKEAQLFLDKLRKCIRN